MGEEPAMPTQRETEPRLRPTEVVRQQVADEGLAAAIMDHALADGDSAEVCARLTARGIPYVSYSGYDPVKGASRCAVRQQARIHGHTSGRGGKNAHWRG